MLLSVYYKTSSDNMDTYKLYVITLLSELKNVYALEIDGFGDIFSGRTVYEYVPGKWEEDFNKFVAGLKEEDPTIDGLNHGTKTNNKGEGLPFK